MIALVLFRCICCAALADGKRTAACPQLPVSGLFSLYSVHQSSFMPNRTTLHIPTSNVLMGGQWSSLFCAGAHCPLRASHLWPQLCQSPILPCHRCQTRSHLRLLPSSPSHLRAQTSGPLTCLPLLRNSALPTPLLATSDASRHLQGTLQSKH